MKPELSSNIKKLLLEITPNFEQNLRRHFIQQCNSAKKLKISNSNISQSLFETVNSKIEIREFCLNNLPTLELVELTADLCNFNLKLKLNIGDIKLTSNELSKTKEPITIEINEISCEGIVGIYTAEDSLVSVNYDLKMSPSGDVSANEKQITELFIQNCWLEMQEFLLRHIDRQMGSVIVEYSVQELLCDEDSEYKEYSRLQKERANKITDNLLNSVLKECKSEVLSQLYQKEINCDDKDLKLSISKGNLIGINTLRRKGNFSINEDSNSLTIFGSLYCQELKILLDDLHVEYEGYNKRIPLEVGIEKNRMQIKITLSRNAEVQSNKLVYVETRVLEDLSMEVDGVPDQFAIGFEVFVRGYLKTLVSTKFQENLETLFTNALKDVNIFELY